MSFKPTGKHCHYCSVELVRGDTTHPGVPWPMNLETKDHVIPRCVGGTQKVPCCYWCNLIKCHVPENDFILRLIFWARRNPVGAKFLISQLEIKGEIPAAREAA